MSRRVVRAPPGARKSYELYKRFRERAPERAKVVRIALPETAFVLGHVESINYVSTLGSRAVRFKHTFAPGSRPLLAAGSRRNQLILVGGRYRVTERGIVDLTGSGREIEDGGYRKRKRR